MSLTAQIRDPASPVSAWMRVNLDAAAVMRHVAAANEQLARRRPVSVKGTDVRLVGRAFDYAFRWQFDEFTPHVAELGASYCPKGEALPVLFDAPAWDEAPAIVRKLVEVGTGARNPALRWLACCLFGWFEELYRSQTIPAELQAIWGQPVTRAGLLTLLRAVPAASADDVAALFAHVAEDWGAELCATPRALNPIFAGSGDVGGADADWILGTTLWDSKVSRQRRPFRADYLQQALGYVLLDYDDTYRLDAVGWYFPRQRLRLRHELSAVLADLCGVTGDPAHALRDLRASFRRAVAGGRQP